MSLTSIVGKVFLPRQMNLQRHQTDAELLQATVLRHLLDKDAETEYGYVLTLFLRPFPEDVSARWPVALRHLADVVVDSFVWARTP